MKVEENKDFWQIEKEKKELEQLEEKKKTVVKIIEIEDLEYLLKIKLKCLKLAVESCKSFDGRGVLSQSKEYFDWLVRID